MLKPDVVVLIAVIPEVVVLAVRGGRDVAEALGRVLTVAVAVHGAQLRLRTKLLVIFYTLQVKASKLPL